jgi:hypothetical protein
MTIFFLAPGPLMIVHDFNIPRIVIDPSKADAPLVIYPNAHLTDSASLEQQRGAAAARGPVGLGAY